MRLFAFALAATSALVAMPRPASACSLATNDLWIQNEAHGSDVTAPSLPAIGGVEVTRHFEDEQSGCGRNVSSCGSFGIMEIEVSASDERAQAQDIGYEVRIVGGETPVAFDPTREGRVRPYGDGRLIFFFDVESPDFSVDLEIRAVDGNGNVGDPIIVTVTDEQPGSSSGCATHKHGSLVGFGVIAFAAALVMRRRRQSLAIVCRRARPHVRQL